MYIYNTVLNSWVTNFTVSAGFDSTTKKSDSGASSSSSVATESAMAKTPCPSPSSWTMVDFVSSCIPSEESNNSSQSSASTYVERTQIMGTVTNMLILYQTTPRFLHPIHPPFPSTPGTQVLKVTHSLYLSS